MLESIARGTNTAVSSSSEDAMRLNYLGLCRARVGIHDSTRDRTIG